MTIIEAIKSGKPFRRPDWAKGLYAKEIKVNVTTISGHNLAVDIDELLANDWEIQEEKIEVTRSQAIKAFHAGVKTKVDKWKKLDEVEEDFCRALGFKE